MLGKKQFPKLKQKNKKIMTLVSIPIVLASMVQGSKYKVQMFNV
jgi:hypothetical protein